MAQADEVEAELLDFSRAFHGVAFAFVEADCIGGHCLYSGFCCRDGQKILTQDQATHDNLDKLVGEVGIKFVGAFEPFQRGFVYLAYTAFLAGFPIGRTGGAVFVAFWFALSVYDLITGHQLLDWMYSDESDTDAHPFHYSVLLAVGLLSYSAAES